MTLPTPKGPVLRLRRNRPGSWSVDRGWGLTGLWQAILSLWRSCRYESGAHVGATCPEKMFAANGWWQPEVPGGQAETPTWAVQKTLLLWHKVIELLIHCFSKSTFIAGKGWEIPQQVRNAGPDTPNQQTHPLSPQCSHRFCRDLRISSHPVYLLATFSSSGPEYSSTATLSHLAGKAMTYESSYTSPKSLCLLST